MKILLGSSTLLLAVFFTSLEGGLSSCSKDKTIYDTVTVIKKDTTTINDTLIIRDTTVLNDTFLTAAMLTAHPWRIQELRGLMEGTPIYYLRGSVTNAINYDNEYLLFNSDTSGSYVDANGASRVISWNFQNTEHTKLIFTIYDTPTDFPITWEHIRFLNDTLYYDEYYKDGNNGNDWHGQGIRIR